VRAEQDVARLRFLEGMGLAQRVGEASWKLLQDHERNLRERQLSKDIIRAGRAASRAALIDGSRIHPTCMDEHAGRTPGISERPD
jgi:hypothetical protein